MKAFEKPLKSSCGSVNIEVQYKVLPTEIKRERAAAILRIKLSVDIDMVVK